MTTPNSATSYSAQLPIDRSTLLQRAQEENLKWEKLLASRARRAVEREEQEALGWRTTLIESDGLPTPPGSTFDEEENKHGLEERYKREEHELDSGGQALKLKQSVVGTARLPLTPPTSPPRPPLKPLIIPTPKSSPRPAPLHLPAAQVDTTSSRRHSAPDTRVINTSSNSAATRPVTITGTSLSLPPPALSWDVNAVSRWITDSGFGMDVADLFKRCGIDGGALLQLDGPTLQTMGVPTFGRRMRLSNAIAHLRAGQEMTRGSRDSVPLRAVEESPLGALAALRLRESREEARWIGGRRPGSEIQTDGSSSSSPPVRSCPSSFQQPSQQSSRPLRPNSDRLQLSPALVAAAPRRASSPSLPQLPQARYIRPVSHDSSSAAGSTQRLLPSTNSSSSLVRPTPPFNNRTSFDTASTTQPDTQELPKTVSAPLPQRPKSTQPQLRVTAPNNPAIAPALVLVGPDESAAYLRLRISHSGLWAMRYIVIRGSELWYYRTNKDPGPIAKVSLRGYKIFLDSNLSRTDPGLQLLPPPPSPSTPTAPTLFLTTPDLRSQRFWARKFIRATIYRDYSLPALSSCETPTISLSEAWNQVSRAVENLLPEERVAHRRSSLGLLPERSRGDPELTLRDVNILVCPPWSPVIHSTSKR